MSSFSTYQTAWENRNSDDGYDASQAHQEHINFVIESMLEDDYHEAWAFVDDADLLADDPEEVVKNMDNLSFYVSKYITSKSSDDMYGEY